MKKPGILLSMLFLFLCVKSYPQGFTISTPKLEFQGNRLMISYDFINKKQADQFYVWVEMEKRNGETIQVKTLSGDVGPHVKSGLNKQIIWMPDKDAVFLNEEVFVEVKAEKYLKSFNRGAVMLMSTVMPGLGQTKVSNGKPWWLTGVAAYGALAGGLIVHNSYLKTYDSYQSEVNPTKRAELFDKTQQQMNVSSVLFISGLSVWAANILWVAVIPNKYQALKYVNISLNPSPAPDKGTALLTMRVNF